MRRPTSGTRTLTGCAPMITSFWPLPRPGRVERKGFCATWLDLRLPLGVPPSVFCVPVNFVQAAHAAMPIQRTVITSGHGSWGAIVCRNVALRREEIF